MYLLKSCRRDQRGRIWREHTQKSSIYGSNEHARTKPGTLYVVHEGTGYHADMSTAWVSCGHTRRYSRKTVIPPASHRLAGGALHSKAARGHVRPSYLLPLSARGRMSASPSAAPSLRGGGRRAETRTTPRRRPCSRRAVKQTALPRS